MRGATGWEIESSVGAVVRRSPVTRSTSPTAWRARVMPGGQPGPRGAALRRGGHQLGSRGPEPFPRRPSSFDGTPGGARRCRVLPSSPLLSPPSSCRGSSRSRSSPPGGIGRSVGSPPSWWRSASWTSTSSRICAPNSWQAPGDRAGPQCTARDLGREMPPVRLVRGPPPGAGRGRPGEWKRRRSLPGPPQWGGGRRPETGSIPDIPGSYQFGDAAGRVLYVWKAKSLRSRGWPYFCAALTLVPTRQDGHRQCESVEWIEVRNGCRGRFPRPTLNKRHRPRFNIRYKDDKS